MTTYTCKRCGANATHPGHLCQPCSDHKTCRFCGALDIDTQHRCKVDLSAMKYVCDGCGRIATQASLLCKPAAIG
ncbi:MAG: hypothetical protein M0036_18790 [Desulfobacteraceae bacterium]|nr:hypothetical protein [Desulfobacteraceae bacterium]